MNERLVEWREGQIEHLQNHIRDDDCTVWKRYQERISPIDPKDENTFFLDPKRDE